MGGLISDETACACCGKIHRPDELELCYRRPDPVVALGTEQREAVAKETDDLCSIGEDRFFVRAILPLPVLERERSYNLGVWVEVSREAFLRVIDLWHDADQANEPPFEAMLANRLPDLPEISGLPVQLQLTGPTTRPRIIVPAWATPCIGSNVTASPRTAPASTPGASSATMPDGTRGRARVLP